MRWSSRLARAGALSAAVVVSVLAGPAAAQTTAPLPHAVAPCALQHGLKATVHGQNGASGTTLLWIVYVNTGLSACTLRGLPGAQPVDGPQHTPVGPASRHERSGGRGGVVVLGRGGGTANTVYTLTIKYYEPPSCKPEPTTAVLLHFKGTPAFAVAIRLKGAVDEVCTTLRSTTIDGIRAGTTGPD